MGVDGRAAVHPLDTKLNLSIFVDVVYAMSIFLGKGSEMATTSMNIRMDSGIKKQAQELFAALGLDMSTAVNIFLRQAIQRQGLPFEVVLREPNAETLEAKAEVEAMKQAPEKHQGYKNSDAMMRELLA